jgi:hypothetical protein
VLVDLVDALKAPLGRSDDQPMTSAARQSQRSTGVRDELTTIHSPIVKLWCWSSRFTFGV